MRMAERVRVREIDDDEGRRLLRIVRRGTGSVVTWRRAQMVLLSGYERREAGHVLVADVEAVRAQLVHRGVHVPRGEQHERVEDQSQGADLVLEAVSPSITRSVLIEHGPWSGDLGRVDA